MNVWSWWQSTYLYRGLKKLPLTPHERMLYFWSWSIFDYIVAYVLQVMFDAALHDWQLTNINTLQDILLAVGYVIAVSVRKYPRVLSDRDEGRVLMTVEGGLAALAAERNVTLPRRDEIPGPPPAAAAAEEERHDFPC